MKVNRFVVQIAGELWDLWTRCRLKGQYGRVEWHLKRIKISREHEDAEDLAGTLIHEALHVLLPNYEEDAILEMERSIMRVLETSIEFSEKEVPSG